MTQASRRSTRVVAILAALALLLVAGGSQAASAGTSAGKFAAAAKKKTPLVRLGARCSRSGLKGRTRAKTNAVCRRRSGRLRWVRATTATTAKRGTAAPKPGGTTATTAPIKRGEDSDDEGTPAYGGKLVYGLESESSNGFNPATATLAISGHMVAHGVYDPLTITNQRGEVVPFLAKSVKPNATYTEWTITARDNVKFHSGEDLNAIALKQNFDANRGSAIVGPVYAGVVKSIDVVDLMSIKVTMNYPWVAFPSYLTATLGYMVAPSCIVDKDCGRKPAGTGPFRFKEWKLDDHLTLVRNAAYWRAGLPYLAEVEYRPIPAVQARSAALESGQINIMHTANADEIKKFRSKRADFKLLEANQFGETGYVMLNVSKAPLNDRRVRRALAFATDNNTIRDLRGAGIVDVANGPFPKGAIGFLENSGYPKFDLDEAKKLVKEYEADKGPVKFKFGTTTDPFNLETNQLIQAMWKKAGIDVELDQVEQQAYIGKALVGAFDAFAWRNHGGTDPDQQFIWWHSAFASDIGKPALNFGRIKDANIDKALLAGRTSSDPSVRRTEAENVNKIFGSEAYNIWSTWTLWGIIASKKVHNITNLALPEGGESFDIIGGSHWLAQIYIK